MNLPPSQRSGAEPHAGPALPPDDAAFPASAVVASHVGSASAASASTATGSTGATKPLRSPRDIVFRESLFIYLGTGLLGALGLVMAFLFYRDSRDSWGERTVFALVSSVLAWVLLRGPRKPVLALRESGIGLFKVGSLFRKEFSLPWSAIEGIGFYQIRDVDGDFLPTLVIRLREPAADDGTSLSPSSASPDSASGSPCPRPDGFKNRGSRFVLKFAGLQPIDRTLIVYPSGVPHADVRFGLTRFVTLTPIDDSYLFSQKSGQAIPGETYKLRHKRSLTNPPGDSSREAES